MPAVKFLGHLQKDIRENTTHYMVFLLIALTSVFIPNAQHWGVDDGYYMSASLRMSNGELPYRDFFYLYPPLLSYIYLPFIKFLNGPEFIFASRLALAAITFASAILCYKLALKLLNRKLSFAASLMFMLLNYAKFPYLSPSALANAFSLITLTIIFNKEALRKAYYPMLALSFILILFSKHNIGFYMLFAFLACSAFLSFAEKKKIKQAFLHILPEIAVSIVSVSALLAYMAAASFRNAYAGLVKFPQSYQLINFDLSNPYIARSFIPIQLLLAFFALFFMFFYFRNKLYKKEYAVNMLFAFAALNLMQLFLYRDFIHATDGLVFAPLCLLYLYKNRPKSGYSLLLKKTIAAAFLLLILLGSLVVWRVWIKDSDWTGLSYRNSLMLADDIAEYYEVAGSVAGMEGPLFVYPRHAVIYVISKKENPTIYNQFFVGYHNSTSTQQDVIEVLSETSPTVVISKKYFYRNPPDPLIAKYISDSTEIVKTTDNFEIRQFRADSTN
jgi:hypothetical protein